MLEEPHDSTFAVLRLRRYICLAILLSGNYSFGVHASYFLSAPSVFSDSDERVRLGALVAVLEVSESALVVSGVPVAAAGVGAAGWSACAAALLKTLPASLTTSNILGLSIAGSL